MVSSSSSPFHDARFRFYKSTHILTLQIPMDLVFVLKWVKSVIRCVLYVFHFSGWDTQKYLYLSQDLSIFNLNIVSNNLVLLIIRKSAGTVNHS